MSDYSWSALPALEDAHSSRSIQYTLTKEVEAVFLFRIYYPAHSCLRDATSSFYQELDTVSSDRALVHLKRSPHQL